MKIPGWMKAKTKKENLIAMVVLVIGIILSILIFSKGIAFYHTPEPDNLQIDLTDYI